MKTDKELAELIEISNATGADRTLVLGGFGNTSVKTADGRYMYIKASGTALKDMTDKIGWRRLAVAKVSAILKDKSIVSLSADKGQAEMVRALLCACDDNIKADVRPSIESCLHSMLARYVIHLHPVAVLALACIEDGQARLEKLFSNERFPAVWVPYADPGYRLAKKVQKLIADYKSRYQRGPAILFLQNHGLFVTADSAKVALHLVRKVVDMCSSRLEQAKVKPQPADKEAIARTASAVRQAFRQATGRDIAVSHFIDETIAGFMADKNAARLCSAAAVTPDELVYAHGPAMWLEKPDIQTILDKLNRRIADSRQIPASVLVKPLGLFVVADEQQSSFIREVVGIYLSVRSFAASLGTIHPLNKRQRQFIISQYK